jgi:hypothetical protein
MLEHEVRIELDAPNPSSVPFPNVGGNRHALLCVVAFLLACLDRVSSDNSAANTEYQWLDEWSDEDYLYLETLIPDDRSGFEIDLNLNKGSINARIARRIDDGMDSRPTVK